MKTIQVILAALCVASSAPGWAEVTSLGGAPYASLCQSRGVPLPPRWGETDPARPRWAFNGSISPNNLFIGKERSAFVYYYSTAQGVCMGLPRYNAGIDTNAALFGVICQGSNGKVCFWDNAAPIPVNPPAPLWVASTNASDLVGSPWIGGADLVPHTSGGMCTDCHRGENPFIVVPAAATDLRNQGISQFSGVWYEPIVGAGWLQNVGPGAVPSPTNPVLGAGDGNCLQCHAAGGGSLGGRFPALGLVNGGSSGYCTLVLDQARILKKMPPFDPGTISYDKHWNAIFAACNQPGPPTTGGMQPSVRHALDPKLVVVSQLPMM